MHQSYLFISFFIPRERKNNSSLEINKNLQHGVSYPQKELKTEQRTVEQKKTGYDITFSSHF